MLAWLRTQGWAIWAGLAVSVIAALLPMIPAVGGWVHRLELLGLDFHVRHFSRIPASDRILHIDIDDESLERVESWPWPRDLQGEIIRILHELGAQQIVMDLVWTEPRGGEARLPQLDRYAEIDAPATQPVALGPDDIVYPDDELAAAIAEAGSVYLSMYDEPATGTVRGQNGLRGRLAELLRADFDLTAAELARRLPEHTPESIEQVLAGVKREVARERVAAVLATQPSATPAQVHAALVDTPFERATADRADIIAAYARELSLREFRARCRPMPEKLRGRIPKMSVAVPPYYKFTAGARGTGFVTFRPDTDGSTRHIPLLMEWEGRLVEQLAFAAAREALDIRDEDLSVDRRGDLVIAARGSRPAMRVQLNHASEMLINWQVPQSGGWERSFRHLPVTQLLRIHDARRVRRENARLRDARIVEVMRLVRGEDGAADYQRQVVELRGLERALRTGGSDAPATEQVERLARQLMRDVQDTVEFVEEQWTALAADPNPDDPEIAQDYARFREAHRILTEDIPEIDRVQERIAAEERRVAEQLRPIVDGRICFVGYTATAVADMVTTPHIARMPGVLVHSNLLNNFLTGQFRRWSPTWLHSAVILLMGCLATLITATRGPRVTVVLVLGLVGIALIVNALVVFGRGDYWLKLVTAILAAMVAWAVVVLVRFLTTDRQRRQLGRAVSQYVSPAMARRIADTSSRLDLAPASRVVTCFFSDLAGFTRISERLGPEGTKTVLNPYLETMSAVLHRHRALINKFIGDGIFAFFNPPILPCEDHALAACAAAIDSRDALRELVARFVDHPLAEEFRQLDMRIGIASGPVFVGDYGSERKLDYTCVGDTVNLASRLEGANKVFGTRILISGATRDAIGDAFVCRPLGVVQVKGQTVGVRLYELVARSGQADESQLAFVEQFAAGVEQYGRGDLAAARASFEACTAIRFDDAASRLYLRKLEEVDGSAAQGTWSGTIELTEK